MLSHARSTAACSRSAATRSVNGSIRVASSASMPCCPEISRVLPRLRSTPPSTLSLLFWVSSASGLARAVTLSTHVPHAKLRRAVSIAQPRLCLGRGMHCHASAALSTWSLMPRTGWRPGEPCRGWRRVLFIELGGAAASRAGIREWMQTESFEDCGKAVLLIVGLLGPHRSQASPLFKEKCRRNRKLQGRADRGSLASKLRAI